MRYLWRDQSFEMPDGLIDRSVIVLVDGSDDGGLGLSLAYDVLPAATAAALGEYVDEVIREASTRLQSLRVTAREQREVGGKDTLVLAQTASAEPGHQVAQLQAFVREGAAVTIVTVSCDPDEQARARQILDGVVASIKRVNA